MVNTFVKSGWFVFGVEKTSLFDNQPGFSTFAELQTDECDGSALPMPQEQQSFGLQTHLAAPYDQFRQPLWLMDQKKVAAGIEGFGGSGEKFCRRAAILPPGKRGAQDISFKLIHYLFICKKNQF